MSILIIVGLALVALIAGYVTWKKDFGKKIKRVRLLQSAGASIAAVTLVASGGMFVSSATEKTIVVDNNVVPVSSESSYDSVDELVARVKEREAAGDFKNLTDQNVGSIKEHRYYAYDADPGSFNFGPNPGFTEDTTADEALETYVYVLLTDPLNAAASYEMRSALAQERFYSLEGVKAYADKYLVNSYENRERALREFLKSIDIESVKLVKLDYQYNTLGMKPGSDPSVMPELLQFDNLPYMNLTLTFRTKGDEKERGMLLRTDCLFQPSIPVTPKQEQSFYRSVPKVQAKQQPQPTQPRVTITPGKQKPPAPPAPPSTQTTVTQPPKTTTTTTEKTTTETTTLPPKTTTSTTTTTKPPKTTTETTTQTTTEKTTTPKTTEPTTTKETTPPPSTTETTPKTTEPTTETTTTTSLEPKDPEEDPAKNGDAPAPQEPTITVENPEPEPSAVPTDVMPDEPTNPAPPEPTTIPRDPVEDETEVVIPPVEGGATPEDPVEGIIEFPWFDPDPSYEVSTTDTSGYNENIVEDPAPVVSDPIVHEPISTDPIVVEDAPSGPTEAFSYEEPAYVPPVEVAPAPEYIPEPVAPVEEAPVQDIYVPEVAAPAPPQEEIVYVNPVIPESAPPAVAETFSDPIPVVDNGEVVTDAIELSSVSETTNNEYLKGIAALAVLAMLYAGIAVWRRRSN